MSKLVLVTGGSGFIGSHVVDKLRDAGYRVRNFDTRPSPWHDSAEVPTVIGDVTRLDDVLGAARGCVAICHLAAAADVGDVFRRPALSTELNSIGTLNVLEAARCLDIDRVVYASTVWVYSDLDEEVVDEEMALQAPAHLYTAGKLSGELYCRSYAELYGVQSTVVRFGIPYGPRARPAAVIPAFVDRARRGETLTISGTGEQERTFVYVEDLADGVVRSLAPQAAGRTYNLAGTETTTVLELAELVRDEVAPVKIKLEPGRPGDLKGAQVSSDRAAEEIGWQAVTPLREGVRRYTDWLDTQAALPAEQKQLEAKATSARSALSSALRRVAGVAGDPGLVGTIAAVAIISAMVSNFTETRSEDLGLLAMGFGLVLPLWALVAIPWPEQRRGAQSATAALIGIFGVLLITMATPDQMASFGANHWIPALMAVTGSVAFLRYLSRTASQRI